MRIVWHSNAPWASTGYGQQTQIFAPRIKGLGHDLAISAFWGLGGTPLTWNGIKVYPADENFGNATLPAIAAHEEADLVITLMDVWVLKSPLLATLPLACWVPIDHNPAPPMVLDFFKLTGARPIAMSRFGERMLRDEGLEPLYVPHGIDTDIFRPRARDAAREAMGLGPDDFLVGMNAFNKGVAPARKAFPQVFQAFARFRKERPNSYLYLHTEMSPRHEGLHLYRLAELAGIPEDAIKTTRPWKYEMGATQAELSALYSMFDVLANPSYGEGFGVPIIESLACGTPVIVTDFSSMTELCGAGWLVEGDDWYHPQQDSFYKCPSVDSIVRCLHEAYDARHDEGLRAKAREFALQYDADRVLEEFWMPALAELDHPRLENEPWLDAHIPTRGGLALDIGANAGAVTTRLAASFDQVHAFEPGGIAAEIPRGDGVEVYKKAIGAESGSVTLNTYADHAHTSAFPDWTLDTLTRGQPTGSIEAEIATLDDLGYAARQVDFIKIDTEGFEVGVLLGALKTLQASKPRLLVEIHSADNGQAVAKLLADIGYEIEPIPHPDPNVPPGHHWLDCHDPLYRG